MCDALVVRGFERIRNLARFELLGSALETEELPLLAAAPDQRGDKQDGCGGQRAELSDRFPQACVNGLLLLRGAGPV
ncbi:MAG: hypothetical protein ABSB35_32885 [Bryobacteraceae bacterium]|jgi:hypothetical protein